MIEVVYLSRVDKGIESSFLCYAFDIYIRENNGRVIATTINAVRQCSYKGQDL